MGRNFWGEDPNKAGVHGSNFWEMSFQKSALFGLVIYNAPLSKERFCVRFFFWWSKWNEWFWTAALSINEVKGRSLSVWKPWHKILFLYLNGFCSKSYLTLSDADFSNFHFAMLTFHKSRSETNNEFLFFLWTEKQACKVAIFLPLLGYPTGHVDLRPEVTSQGRLQGPDGCGHPWMVKTGFVWWMIWGGL